MVAIIKKNPWPLNSNKSHHGPEPSPLPGLVPGWKERDSGVRERLSNRDHKYPGSQSIMKTQCLLYTLELHKPSLTYYQTLPSIMQWSKKDKNWGTNQKWLGLGYSLVVDGLPSTTRCWFLFQHSRNEKHQQLLLLGPHVKCLSTLTASPKSWKFWTTKY